MINIAKLVGSIGFQIEKQSLKEVNATFNNIEKRLAGLRGQFAKGLSFGNLRTKGTLSHINGINKSIANLHKNMREGLPAVNDYTKAIQQMAAAFADVRSNLPRLPRTPNGITGGGGGDSGGRKRRGGFAGFVGGLVGSPMGMAAALLPGVGAGWAIKTAIDTGRNMQSTQLAYQAVMGNPEAGNAQYQSIMKMARDMRMDAMGSVEGFKGLLASSINAEGFGKNKEERAKKAQDIFRGVSSYGLAIGLDDESMKGSLKAIQQMMGKGKVYSEELTQQLAERMPAATQILADSMGVTVAQLYQMLKDGKVMSAEVLPKMAAYMERIATDSGALAKYMDSSLAKQRQFKNEMTAVVDKIWQGGGDQALGKFFEILTKILSVMTPLLRNMGGVLLFVFERLSRAVNVILWPLEGLVKLFEQLNGFGKVLMVTLGIGMVASIDGVAKSLRGLGSLAFRVMLPFTLLYLLLEDLYGWSKNDGTKSVIGTVFGEFQVYSDWLQKNFFSPWQKFFDDLNAIKDFMKDLTTGKITEEVKERAAKAGINLAGTLGRQLIPGVDNGLDFIEWMMESYKKSKAEAKPLREVPAGKAVVPMMLWPTGQNSGSTYQLHIDKIEVQDGKQLTEKLDEWIASINISNPAGTRES